MKMAGVRLWCKNAENVNKFFTAHVKMVKGGIKRLVLSFLIPPSTLGSVTERCVLP